MSRARSHARFDSEAAHHESRGLTSLPELEARFARFRRTHERGARVPQDLREAALASLEGGVSAGQLRRGCGVSWAQLESWKASRSAARPGEGQDPAVRVLSIVDDDGDAPSRGAGAGALELRFGPWSVTVRQQAGLGREEG